VTKTGAGIGDGLPEIETWMPRPRPTRLPYPSLGPLFKGRTAVLSGIHDAVRRGGRFGATLTVQVIEGMGGIGKTRAAVEYAWAHRDGYAALLFVSAETPNTLHHDLAALTGMLGLDRLDNRPEAFRLSAVLDWLNGNPGWLLILDNVDTVAAAKAVGDLLGRLSGGHVLLTSRRRGFAPGVKTIALDGLDRTDAAALLLEQTEGHRPVTPTDPADATALATELGALPLALELAAATIRQRHCSLADYRPFLRESRDTLTGTNEPVISTYRRNIDALLLGAVEQLPAEARTLLERLAFLAPDPVPAFLLDVPVPNDGTTPEAASEALDDLAPHSLVNRGQDGASFTVHPLVQDAMRRRLDTATASRRLVEALGWIDTAFAGDPEDLRTWPRLDPLASHAEAVAGYADAAGVAEPTVHLMDRLARLFQTKGSYSRADPLFHRAVAIAETLYGPNDAGVASYLNNLAQLLQATNRLGEAEPLMRRALAITEAGLGKDHPNVAIRLSNLGALLQATNRLGEAEPLMRRALAIDEASLGKNHPDVAACLNNLARLLHNINRPSEAEPLYRRALTIWEASLGKDHPKVAAVLNNLAALLQATSRFGEAEQLYLRAIAINETSLGTDHPSVAPVLTNLAELLKDTNRIGEAEPLLWRVLAIGEANLGKDHPTVATRLNNLAGLLKDTNRIGEAEPLYRRALAIDEASLGKDHPDVARDLINLATLLQATNRPGEAEPLYRRALLILETSLGKDHPNVAFALNNLARLLQETGRLGEAEPLMRRHLAIFLAFQRDTGHAHPRRDAAIGNYTRLLAAMGRSDVQIAEEFAALRHEVGLVRA
jgi:tetratricopeptide (TPR) repeat protein